MPYRISVPHQYRTSYPCDEDYQFKRVHTFFNIASPLKHYLLCIRRQHILPLCVLDLITVHPSSLDFPSYHSHVLFFLIHVPLTSLPISIFLHVPSTAPVHCMAQFQSLLTVIIILCFTIIPSEQITLHGLPSRKEPPPKAYTNLNDIIRRKIHIITTNMITSISYTCIMLKMYGL